MRLKNLHFNKHLFWYSLTVGCTLTTLALAKSEGRFLKILSSSWYGTWAWSWKQPAFPLHLCWWKTGAVLCNCALYSEVSYINSPYNYTQEHTGYPCASAELVFTSVICSPLVHITVPKMFYFLFWLTWYWPKSFTSKYTFFSRISVKL